MSVDAAPAMLSVDLDAHVPCTACETGEATWRGRTLCPAGHAWRPICDPCRARVIVDLALMSSVGPLACARHDTLVPRPHVEWATL